jgi:hypothetical protein
VALGVPFEVRWNSDALGQPAVDLLGTLRCPSEDDRPPVLTYWLIDAGAAARPRYGLFRAPAHDVAADDPEVVVDYLLWSINVLASSKANGYVVVHAGVVADQLRDRAVLLPADSGSGKSTLVAGLLSAGFTYLSDEYAAIGVRDGRVVPYLRLPTFKPGSWPLIAAATGLPPPSGSASWHVPLEALRAVPAPAGRRYDIGTVIYPRYVDQAALRTSPVSPSRTLARLLRHVVNRSDVGPPEMAALTSVAASTAAVDLEYGMLDEAVQAVSDCAGRRAMH